MSTTTKRTHRHRRSQAISGDFDAIGLGLYAPFPHSPSNAQPPFRPTHHDTNSQLLLPNDIASPTKDLSDEELNRHFNFNNEEDFSNTADTEHFSFPNKLDLPPPPQISTSLPRKFMHSSTNSLNSPIRFKKPNPKPAQPTLIPPPPRLFLTEETTLNNENIPEAMIDLDEILNANLHIGTNNTPPRFIRHKRMESAPAMYNHELLGSPFIKYTEVENPEVNILEEEDETSEEEEMLQPPSNIFYDNQDDSSPSSIISSKNERSSKRSGATATRYQIFYDQSNKISNALKSNESLSSASSNLIYHSSSLSNLKTKRSSIRYPPRAVSSPLKLESSTSSPISTNTQVLALPISTPATTTSTSLSDENTKPGSNSPISSPKSSSPISSEKSTSPISMNVNAIKPTSPISWQVSSPSNSILTDTTSKSKLKSPRRPESLAECNILKTTQIPKYKPKSKPTTPIKQEFSIFDETNHPPQYMNKRELKEKDEHSFRKVKYWFKRH